jgi:energy-coupling factor transport system ATP-binding protein
VTRPTADALVVFDRVSVTYPDAARPVLRDVSFTVPEGELVLVIGRTGSGKSTLLGAVNGLVPHFTGGTLAGRVTVAGRSTRDLPPREFADLVGVVGQDPLAGFVTDTVEQELAYGMEQLALAPAVMRKRVEETLDLLGLAELRDVPLRELSGGQQQRVAIGAVLTAHPRVLVLDEPTSALDPGAAEEVLAALTRLVHDLAVTVLLAEHRLERIAQHADTVLLIDDGRVRCGTPDEEFAVAPIVPPVVELGRVADCRPVPLTVRDARRGCAHLRALLPPEPPITRVSSALPDVALRARSVRVTYGELVAVRDVDLDLHAGEITALMGRNGSGKSSLLWALHGSGPRGGHRVTLVPQTPADLLYLDTVGAELHAADRYAHTAGPSARELLDRFCAGISDRVHPRDLSEGQRLALVLALQLRSAPAVVLLDEPTRGLDYAAKHRLAATLGGLARDAVSTLVATHDVEFAAAVADRVVVLAEGEIVADGPAADVLAASPAFAPQVSKVLAPLPYLTVEQVARALEAVA